MGKPVPINIGTSSGESIARERPTKGTETSQYLIGKENNSDSPSSGERTGKSLNRVVR
jgi:hypothetical protein